MLIYLPTGSRELSRVLNVKALVGAFNQEKALLGSFSVIVKFSPIVRLQLYQSSSHLLSDSILVGGAPLSPRHSQVTSARGKASTLHSSCTRRPGLADTFCTGTWTSGRTAERTVWI